MWFLCWEWLWIFSFSCIFLAFLLSSFLNHCSKFISLIVWLKSKISSTLPIKFCFNSRLFFSSSNNFNLISSNSFFDRDSVKLICLCKFLILRLFFLIFSSFCVNLGKKILACFSVKDYLSVKSQIFMLSTLFLYWFENKITNDKKL